MKRRMDAAPANLRRAQIADAAEVARLAGELGYPISSPQIADLLSELLANERHHVVVAVSGDRLCGWLHVEHRISLEGGHRAEIMGLVVDSTARRRRFGTQLLRAAEEWARAQGMASLTVRSNVVRESSHPFYESHGYLRSKTQHVYVKVVASDPRPG